MSAQAEGAQRSTAPEETPTIRQLALAYSADELMPHPLPEEDRACGVPIWQLTTDEVARCQEVRAEDAARTRRSLLRRFQLANALAAYERERPAEGARSPRAVLLRTLQQEIEGLAEGLVQAKVQAEVYEGLDRSLYEDEGSSLFAQMKLPPRKGRHAFSVGIGGSLVDVAVHGSHVELRQGGVWIAEAYWGERTIVAGTRSLGQPCSGTGLRAEAAPQAEMVYQLLDTFLVRLE